MITATSFAPATVANVAVGFDVLGFALDARGDRVTATRLGDDGPAVAIGTASGVAEVPLDPARNTAAVAAMAMLASLDLPWRIRLDLDKGIPLGSGLGGSAASAVGAVVALNALLPAPLPPRALLPFALAGEAAASGTPHADNVAPCLCGGLQAVLPDEHGGPPSSVAVPLPAGIHCALAVPRLRIDTRQSRQALAETVPLRRFVQQTAHLACFVAACASGDLALLGRCLRDVVIEPQRSAAIPGFSAMQAAALAAGALGCSIAGSGPALFAWTEGAPRAEAVLAAMRTAAPAPLQDAFTARVGAAGARVEP